MKIVVTNPRDINSLQLDIMELVTVWARREKVPIPRKVIVREMGDRGIGYFTVVNALRALNNKGYLRKAVTVSNTTSYVQLRGV